MACSGSACCSGVAPGAFGVLQPEEETLESWVSSIRAPAACLFLRTDSISCPVGTKVRDRYFLALSSPSLVL